MRRVVLQSSHGYVMTADGQMIRNGAIGLVVEKGGETWGVRFDDRVLQIPEPWLRLVRDDDGTSEAKT